MTQPLAEPPAPHSPFREPKKFSAALVTVQQFRHGERIGRYFCISHFARPFGIAIQSLVIFQRVAPALICAARVAKNFLRESPALSPLAMPGLLLKQSWPECRYSLSLFASIYSNLCRRIPDSAFFHLLLVSLRAIVFSSRCLHHVDNLPL